MVFLPGDYKGGNGSAVRPELLVLRPLTLVALRVSAKWQDDCIVAGFLGCRHGWAAPTPAAAVRASTTDGSSCRLEALRFRF